MYRVDQEDMDRQEGQEDTESQEAHFSALSQRIFLWPRGLFSKKEALSFSTKSKMIKSSLIFLTVLSFLVVFIGYSQILSKIAKMNIAIQKLQGSSSGNGNDKIQVSNKSLEHANAQAQMADSNMKNTSDEIQVLKKCLENVNAQTQMANNNLKNVSDEILILKTRLENASAQTQRANSNLKNANNEIKRLKEVLENTNALNSETQSLRSDLEKANGEIQKIMGNLANTNNLKVEIQGLKEQLEDLMAQRHQQSHQNLSTLGSLLQLIIQGWSFYEGMAYYISDTKKTWDEAEGFCVSHNSHLASVTSDGEKEFLSKRTHGEYHWIGLTDKDTEGTWHWVDGTPFNESRVFWNKNQPDNWQYGKNLSEDCVHMQVNWNDMLCDKHYPWICKMVPGLPEQWP